MVIQCAGPWNERSAVVSVASPPAATGSRRMRSVPSADSTSIGPLRSGRWVRAWDVEGGKERATLPGHTGPVWVVVFTGDGKTLAEGSWLGEVMLWNEGAVTKADK